MTPEPTSIGIVLRQIRLLKRGDSFLHGNSELCVLRAAFAETDDSQKTPVILEAYFPEAKSGKILPIAGNGLLIYGPGNPGSYVTYVIKIIESDKDIRESGQTLNELITSPKIDTILSTLKLNPTATIAASVIKSVLDIVSSAMIKNKTDDLFQAEGTVFRGSTPPYLLKKIQPVHNEYINAQIQVLPL